MALPFAGDGDVEAVRVLDRLRGYREGQALGDGSVAGMGLVERVEQEAERAAVREDCKGAPAVLVRAGFSAEPGASFFLRGSYILRSSGQRCAPPPQDAWWQPAYTAPFANWMANAPSSCAPENGHTSRA